MSFTDKTHAMTDRTGAGLPLLLRIGLTVLVTMAALGSRPAAAQRVTGTIPDARVDS